jgi:glutathione S-transferase
MNSWVVIVTFGALIFYVATGIRVGRARGRYSVTAPAMTGPPEFERLVRV